MTSAADHDGAHDRSSLLSADSSPAASYDSIDSLERHEYTLDSHGFQFVPHVSREKEFLDEDQIKDQYYQEVDQNLEKATGATRTFIFDHTIRREQQDQRPENADSAQQSASSAATSLRGSVRRVHIDQSYAAAASRVPEEDLVPIGLIYPNRRGETLNLTYNSRHEWFYKHHQTPEEVPLIKWFDDHAGVKRVPYSAFEVPGTEGEEPRASIEVRYLVFHEDDVE